ncbi:phosphotransferase [Rubellicoccus peritrichatus]|uniref:Phosphotransferase n=1 Tax=Rubellicoccus peritrichatus TaxID=3080537 RepID=A0AAQ3L7D0_9BACT|nr:phosphotransferase [Puniceicoccus sp. CR14]WOO40964.1 phosphotransferase [Puniceicoccus sp. CR14]
MSQLLPERREELSKEFPEIILLDVDDPEGLSAYLNSRGMLGDDEVIRSAGLAGEGNMNLTLRVKTDRQRLILKQSFPWVQKYPQIDAPWDRIIREARFYGLTSENASVSSRTPKLFDLDIQSRIAILEDLGEAADFTTVYSGEAINPKDAATLGDWLASLHLGDFDPNNRSALTNRDMRELNHAHIFEIPLQSDNGLNLDTITPGLADAAKDLKSNEDYVKTVQNLGQTAYLEDGPTLLHGDYFPGSWLITDQGIRIIDPEFCFFGKSEFDVGVALAHFAMSGQSGNVAEAFMLSYNAGEAFDMKLANQLAGVEIMRRLIGYGQLPLTADLENKKALLKRSLELVLK